MIKIRPSVAELSVKKPFPHCKCQSLSSRQKHQNFGFAYRLSQKTDFLKLPEACLFVVELPGMQLLPVHQKNLVYLEQLHVWMVN